ncbi:MAG TPA: DUF2269 domain-containing protein [Pseudomonadales bacterium]|nr:DUF2269 domain-containing protein [Pseudomonadales bacterium]
MVLYLLVKTLHILSAAVLFGTGLGIAFFMFRARFTSDVSQQLYAARNTVLADNCFTLPAAFVQPLSGLWLAWQAGFHFSDAWLLRSLFLYALAGACWLPVVWIQLQMRDSLARAHQDGAATPARFFRLFNVWFALGWPAFIAFVIIFYLMVAKPV